MIEAFFVTAGDLKGFGCSKLGGFGNSDGVRLFLGEFQMGPGGNSHVSLAVAG